MMKVGLTGCSVSAHDPFEHYPRQPAFTDKYASHSNRVYVTSKNMPETAKYEVLGQIEVGKVWFGSSDSVLQSIADGARQFGAGAVVEVKTWH